MLILARRVGESIIIDDKEITITVRGIKHGQVLLSINAPKEIGVYREEVYYRIKQIKK